MRRQIAIAIGILALLSVTLPQTGKAASSKRATPPTADEVSGVWIGFDRDELTFTRLELRKDLTGYCARVSPAGTILHDQGVHVWKVTSWSVHGWSVDLQMSPVANAYAVGYVRGTVRLASLRLTMGGPENGGWKEPLLLYPESRINVSNEETRSAVERLTRSK